MLFTDGSVDAKTRVGYGAYLAVSDIDVPLVALQEKLNLKQFENTTSTTLELQTLLWAASEALLFNAEETIEVIIYTDSQNIAGLPARRSHLERQDYCSGSGRRLNNAELYQAFYGVMDQYHCQVIKVDGHKPRHLKNDVDRVFALVDKASRSALRNFSR